MNSAIDPVSIDGTARIVRITVGILLLTVGAWSAFAGSELQDRSDVVRAAVPVSAEDAAGGARREGQIVAVTGTLRAEPIGDGAYLQPGPYLAIRRVTTVTVTGPGATTPLDEEVTFVAPRAAVGAYALEVAEASLEWFSNLPLSDASLALPEGARHDGATIYLTERLEGGVQRFTRIRYLVVPSGITVTAYGVRRGATLAAPPGAPAPLVYPGLRGESLPANGAVSDGVARAFLGLRTLLMILGMLFLFTPLATLLGFRLHMGCGGLVKRASLAVLIGWVLSRVAMVLALGIHGAFAGILAFLLLCALLGAAAARIAPRTPGPGGAELHPE